MDCVGQETTAEGKILRACSVYFVAIRLLVNLKAYLISDSVVVSLNDLQTHSDRMKQIIVCQLARPSIVPVDLRM